MIVRLSPTLCLSLATLSLAVATPPNLQRTYVRTYQDQAVCHLGHCTHLLAHLRTYVHTCARARQPASVGSHYVHTSACTSAAAHLVDHHWAYPLRTYARTCHAPTTQNTYVRTYVRTTSTYVRTLKRSRRQRANHPIIYLPHAIPSSDLLGWTISQSRSPRTTVAYAPCPTGPKEISRCTAKRSNPQRALQAESSRATKPTGT